MNLAVRRRMAAGVVATATAVVAGFLVAPNAQAADTITLSPNSAFNTETKTIAIVLGSNANSPGYPAGSTVTFTRQGTTPVDSFTTDVDPGDPSAPTTTVNFADVANNSGTATNLDGPANPGTYNVEIDDPSGGVFVSDTCTGCFQVLTGGALTATSVVPPAVAAGGSANVTVNGSGFARGTTIAVMLPDGSGPDSTITTNQAPTSSTGTAVTSGVTTPTKIQRRWTIGAGSATGPRDVRVTNVDGTSATCAACFTVNGAPLTAVSPVAGTNDPNGAPVRLTFSGTNLSSGEPSLVFVGDAGSATKNDLTIPGTNPSYNGNSMSADFDLRNAAPGDQVYQPTLTQSDNSQNTCSCRFSVSQPSQPTIASASPNTQKTGTTQSVRITGTNFSKGVKIVVSGAGVTTTSVTFVDPSHVDATFAAASTAAVGARDLSAATTDSTATPAAACKGCYTIQSGASPTVSPSASPCPSSSPSASASSSARPSGSATPSGSASPSGSTSPSPSSSPSGGGGIPSLVPGFAATTSPSAGASSSSSPSASSSTSPSGSASPSSSCNQQKLTITLDRTDITPTQPVNVTAHGAPGSTVELLAYSRPNTTYGVARTGTTDTNGNAVFTVKPGTNTRLYAHYKGGAASSDSVSKVINVHTALSLSAYRDGVRKYHFQGRNLPRLTGQLITLYRISNGQEIRTATVKTNDSGIWRIDRTFTGSGTFTFVARTSQTLNNAAGRSNERATVVH
jgi:hypothetical protein